MSDFSSFRGPEQLTARQREVIKLVAAGRTNAEIGQALGISFETAKMHVGDILNRLGVDSREEAAQIWREHQRPSARLRRALGGVALTPLQRVARMVGSVTTVAAVALVFVALARNDRDPGASVDLIRTRWDLVKLDGQPLANSQRAAYFRLRDDAPADGAARTAEGYGGCNDFGGEYALGGQEVTVTGLIQTLMGCDDLRTNTERRFIGALSAGALDVAQAGDRLTLTAQDGTRFDFVARLQGDPDGLLTDSSWRLQVLDSRTEVAFAEVVFEFGDDGSFATTTGCGPLRGTYERTGFEMSVAVDGPTPPGCAEPARTIDAGLRAALANTETYLVDLTVLSLTYGDTGGVTLRKVEP